MNEEEEEEKVELKISDLSPNLSPRISETTYNRKVYWKSCCFTLDKRAVQFFSQLIISLIIIFFCLFQLHTLDKCDSAEYLSLLTMILGIYIDSPRLKSH